MNEEQQIKTKNNNNNNNNNMNNKTKTDIDNTVTDFCIANKLTYADGLIQLLDKAFESVEQGLASLKADVTETITTESERLKALLQHS